MLKIAKLMITDKDQIVGGQMYTKVLCLDGYISFESTLIVGVPFYPKTRGFKRSTSAFCRTREKRMWSASGSYDWMASLLDKNVEPNTYNDHSLWRFNAKSMAFLTECQGTGREGLVRYLAVLRYHKRGAAYANPDGRFSNARFAA